MREESTRRLSKTHGWAMTEWLAVATTILAVLFSFQGQITTAFGGLAVQVQDAMNVPANAQAPIPYM